MTPHIGFHYELIDEDRTDLDENGLLEDFCSRSGPYETRHRAVGMKAIMERQLSPPDGGRYDYTVRAYPSLFRTADPTECTYCGYAAEYRPLVGWVFVGLTGDREGGCFCSRECHARWAHEHDTRPYPEAV